MKSIFLKILLPILLVALAIFAARTMIMMKPQPKRQTPPVSRPVVTVHTVASDNSAVRVKGFGSVKAKRSVNLVPQVSGQVVEKSPSFEPGDYCTNGQVLLRLDDTDYVLAAARARADVAQMEYNLARAEEEAQVALNEWENMKHRGGETEPTSLVLHEPQLKLARANLDAAKAALGQAEVNLSRCTLTAPFDGRILSVDADVGQYLRSGNTVGAVYATDIAEVTVSLPDDDLAWITIEGDNTEVDVMADFAGARHHWAGRAVRLGGAVDSRSRLVPVVIEIDSPYVVEGNRPPLVEGMFVEVEFNSTPLAGSVVIPRTALRPGNLIWVITPDREVDIRQVTVTRAGVDQAVISEGIEPGEMVCTSNLQVVTQGLQVRLEGEPVAPPAANEEKGGEK